MKFYTSVENMGNTIFERGYENGIQFQHKIEYHPTLFVSSKKNEGWKTLTGGNVSPVKTGTIKDTREFLKKYEGVEGFDIYGLIQFPYMYISDNYQNIEYDKDLIRVLNFDIETTSENGFPDIDTANESVISITMSLNSEKYIVLGTGDFEIPLDIGLDVVYYKCPNEEELLLTFISEYEKFNPDILTGWNIRFFDIPYLVNRIKRLFGEKLIKKFSPWGVVRPDELTYGTRVYKTYNFFGVCNYDYLELYKKFTYGNEESYRLDHIAHVVLGERKLDYSEYSTLHELYKENYQKFIEYNIKDVELVDRIEDKMKFIEMSLVLAYDAKANFIDVFTQVRMWDVLIYNFLRKKKIVIPPKENGDKDSRYEGAFVKEPKPGMYNWVASYDLNSLYPHLIMQYNVSPETLVDYRDLPEGISPHRLNDILGMNLPEEFQQKLKDHKLTLTPNGQFFRTDVHGFLPEMMEKMYNERSEFKKMMLESKKIVNTTKDLAEKQKHSKLVSRYNNMQMARKIQLNSAYGALGNQYFRYFDIRQAEAITLAGQLSIRWVERDVNEYINKLVKNETPKDYVIAADTDSIYLNLEDIVNLVFDSNDKDTKKVIEFMDKLGDGKLQDIIDRSYNNLKNYVNAYEQKMFMKREVLADKGIWTAKKRYMLNVHNSEGVPYDPPELKMMGIEAIKSSTPSACRSKLKEAISIIMNKTEDDLIDFIAKFKKEFKNESLENISFPRSVRGILKYWDANDLWKKSTPIHVKGVLIFNQLLKKHKLTKKYQTIYDGEKIKFIYMKQPNLVNSNVISFMDTLPEEFDLHKHIDYDTQFVKAFEEPLKGILNPIGWETKRVRTLESFFV